MHAEKYTYLCIPLNKFSSADPSSPDLTTEHYSHPETPFLPSPKPPYFATLNKDQHHPDFA